MRTGRPWRGGAPGACAIAIAALLAIAPAGAVDTESKEAPDLSAVRAKIKAKDFKSALVDLNAMINDNVQHADVYNLMGFSLRKTGDLKTAYTFYRKALEFDPEHKGALEYLGELYVQTGEIAKARENLALLVKLCPSGCEEREDLEKAIAEAAAAPGAKPTN
ncbi:MAG: tetratricopeptide repeat protein [Hyphomicrobiaceae bacterium]|nr:tetratricopeptide repeat protein [Hyphomicrobiaceae bacterium]